MNQRRSSSSCASGTATGTSRFVSESGRFDAGSRRIRHLPSDLDSFGSRNLPNRGAMMTTPPRPLFLTAAAVISALAAVPSRASGTVVSNLEAGQYYGDVQEFHRGAAGRGLPGAARHLVQYPRRANDPGLTFQVQQGAALEGGAWLDLESSESTPAEPPFPAPAGCEWVEQALPASGKVFARLSVAMGAGTP